MRSTAIDRRAFLTGCAAALAAAAPNVPRARAEDALAGLAGSDEPLFVAARRGSDGGYALAVTSPEGIDVLTIPLPGRGHDVALCPATGRCLAFARRPGTFAVLFDPLGRADPVTFQAAPGRHFYGHGAFSPDGRLVFATENDFAGARGIIGVYDVSGDFPQRLGEFASGGVGPHDILPMPDGKTLVVANGGIETHPERGRDKLNLATMRPNVTLIDRESGALLAQFELGTELHQLSLRHMAASAGGTVWIGAQHQGAATETPPLLAALDPEKGLRLHDVAPRLRGKLENYVGSVALNREESVVAASCPRAGRMLYFSAADGRFLGSQVRADVCGVAPLDDAGFLLSDGEGGLLQSDAPSSAPLLLASRAGISWDNHMIAIPPR